MAKRKAKSKAVQPAGKAVPSKVFNPPTPGRSVMAGALLAPTSAAPPPDPRVIWVQSEAAGSSGIHVYAGYFAEDYLVNELHGTEAADTYDRMRRSDAKMAMALNAVKMPIIAANWEVQPAIADNAESKLHAEFIEHVLFKDMDRPFSKQELLSLADFGYYVLEVTHKPVLEHPKFGSYVGLRALGWRSPRSVLYWRLNPQDGSIDHIRQLITGDLERFVDIPGQFLLVGTLGKEGDNYEGISLQRPAYGAWKRKNLYLRLMAIGEERNAVPTPIAEIPPNKQNSVEYQNVIRSLQNYTSHQNSYFTYPEGWKVDFLKSTFDPEKLKSAIDFENSEIVSAFMANFLLLGSTQTGSRAVSMDQSEFFLGSIQHVADTACEPLNHKLIPELIKMKFGPQEAYPRLCVSGISDKAGKELADALKALAESQWIQPDDETEAHLRKRYQLPKKSDKGVRIVQAPKSMQQGDNVVTTDHPDKVEEKEKNVQAAEFAVKSAHDMRRSLGSNATTEAAVKLAEGRLKWAIKLASYDVDTRLQFIADDSDNQCDECAEYHERVFDADNAPALPVHPNCECELVPYEGPGRSSDWEKLQNDA